MTNKLNTLGEYFLFYLHRNINKNKDMYNGFWSEVAVLFSEFETGNQLSNTAVRKRFNRKLKRVRSAWKETGEQGVDELVNDLIDYFHVENTYKYGDNIIGILKGERPDYFKIEDSNLKIKELNDGGKEYSSKQDFTKQAEERGVKSEYQAFLEYHGINEEDVTNVYFKEKASGTRFTVQTRFNKEDVDFDPVEAFRQSIENYEIPDYSHIFDKQSDNKKRISVISLFDAHLDKIALIAETDSEADIEKNINNFETAFDDLLQSVATKNPEQILFPVGNDFWHTNDFRLTTKNGTDMSARVHVTGMDAFRLGVNLIRRCIDKARAICDVTIIPVKGNHDEDRVHYLLECLLIAYENQEDVSIIDSRKSRLYYRYGSWLFGFAHGDKERKAKELPNLMATDKFARKHWAEIDKGVFFLGDIHHERRYDYMRGHDFRGCKVMFLRSVGSTDQWHWENGYTGIPKTAYAFLYEKDGKRTQEFKVNI